MRRGVSYGYGTTQTILRVDICSGPDVYDDRGCWTSFPSSVMSSVTTGAFKPRLGYEDRSCGDLFDFGQGSTRTVRRFHSMSFRVFRVWSRSQGCHCLRHGVGVSIWKPTRFARKVITASTSITSLSREPYWGAQWRRRASCSYDAIHCCVICPARSISCRRLFRKCT